MLYSAQSSWGSPSSGTVNNAFRKLDLVPSAGEGRETPTKLSTTDLSQLFLRNPTEYMSPSRHLRTETDPVSETPCFLVFRIPEDGQSLEAQ
jgi:hypothetical protein